MRDLETVKDVSLVELLAQSLKTRVGSSLSIRSSQEDLQVSPNTIERWIGISKSLVMNGKRLGIPRLFQVHTRTKDYGDDKTGRVLPFEKFCLELGMP